MPMREAQDHLPVMVGEVIRILVEGGVDLLVDATLGAGGHSECFLETRGPEARVIGIDRDPEMVARARARLSGFSDRVDFVVGSFADLDAILDERGVGPVDGVLADLGASSVHFDTPERGFSFLAPGPLDMRYDRSRGETAADLVNRLPEADLAKLLADHGEGRHARRIARAIVLGRPIRDTLRLADVVEGAVGRRGRIHPATLTFQVLRIAVNRELDHVERGVSAALSRLGPAGRLVVLSFHSGEDRIVKQRIREAARSGLGRPLFAKPLRPDSAEVRANPRARSARLRACERVGGEGE